MYFNCQIMGLTPGFMLLVFLLGFGFLQMIWYENQSRNQASHWEMQFLLITNEPETT